MEKGRKTVETVMQTIKKFGMSVLTALIFILALATSMVPVMAAGSVRIQMNLVMLPVLQNSYRATASSRVMQNMAENSGSLQSLGDVGFEMKPEYILQPKADLNQNCLSAVVKIVGENGFKLNLRQIRFLQSSAPKNDFGGNDYDLSKVNAIYSPNTVGKIWGAGGEGSVGTIELKASEPGDIMVNEITLIGIQYPYFKYSEKTTGTGDFSADYLLSYAEKNIKSITTTVEVFGDGVIIGAATRILQQSGTPTFPSLKTSKGAGNTISLDYNVSSGNTAYIKWASTIDSLEWFMEASVNGSGTITRTTGTGNKFFRITNQP